MKQTFLLLFFVFMFVISLPVMAKDQVTFKDTTFYPVDQGKYRENFKNFRDNLFKIIENKDVEALKPIIDDDISFTFGIQKGKKDFFEYWELKQDENSEKSDEFWAELKKVITYGGTFSGEKEFQAPYYSSLWPEEFDAFHFGTVIGEDVRAYKETEDGYKPVKSVTYKVVKYDVYKTFNFNDREYNRVYLSNGEKVYISKYYIGSPIGYRASFNKNSNNKWIMTIFIAGD